MRVTARAAFGGLVGVQALHSVEEYVFGLYDRLAPARYVSDLVGLDRATGFAAVNLALVLFGLWCWLGPVRRGGRSAGALAWGWAVVEVASGASHILLALSAGGYFPGLFTAPLLLLAGGFLISRLVRERRPGIA